MKKGVGYFIRTYGELVFLIAMFLFSLGMFLNAFTIRGLSSATDNMGPALMPKIVFGFMTFLCILLFIDYFRNRRGVLIRKATAEVSEEEQAKRKVSTRRGLISIIGIFGFITLVTKLGFFLTSVAYLLFEFFLLDTKRSLKKKILFIVLAIAFSGIVYYVFRYQVFVRLPKGILG